jgi:hypothetical protein
MNMFNDRFPWWLSVLLAIGSFCTLKFVIPSLQPTNHFLQTLQQIGPNAAPLTAIGFLLLAAKQLYDGGIPTDRSKDPDDLTDDD